MHHNTKEDLLREFVEDPDQERRFCQWLDLKTEKEKETEAIVSSAESAGVSAESAKKAIICAVISIGISIIALLIAYFKDCL